MIVCLIHMHYLQIKHIYDAMGGFWSKIKILIIFVLSIRMQITH